MPEKAMSKESSRRLPPLLRRAWYSLNQTFRHRIGHLGITPDQYSILRWLHEGDARGLTQQTITDLMASDPNTITSILRRMEKAALLSRHPHETDRRAHRVRLEPKGHRVFTEAFEIARTLQDEALSVLPESRRARFLAELDAVAEACSEATNRKRPA
jgi:DNA-binding MarR family transcriptional regulator